MTSTERRTELEKRREAGLSLEIPFPRHDVRTYAKNIGALWDPENKAWLPKNEGDHQLLRAIIAGDEEIPSPVAAADALRERDAARAQVQGLQGEVNALRAEVKGTASRGEGLLETRDALNAARAKLAAAGFPSLDAALAEVAALRASGAGLRSLSGVNPAKVAEFVAEEARRAVLSALRAQPPAAPEAEKQRLERANGKGPEFRKLDLEDEDMLSPSLEAHRGTCWRCSSPGVLVHNEGGEILDGRVVILAVPASEGWLLHGFCLECEGPLSTDTGIPHGPPAPPVAADTGKFHDAHVVAAFLFAQRPAQDSAAKTQEVPDAPLTAKTFDPVPGGQASASPPARASGLARCEVCKAPVLGKHVCRSARTPETQKGGAS